MQQDIHTSLECRSTLLLVTVVSMARTASKKGGRRPTTGPHVRSTPHWSITRSSSAGTGYFQYIESHGAEQGWNPSEAESVNHLRSSQLLLGHPNQTLLGFGTLPN
jgi:hypothetical protein